MVDNRTKIHYNKHINSNKQELKMARKTKAELAAEREEAQAAREAHEFAQYPTRLLNALELATSMSYELTVKESKFVVRNYNAREEFYLTPMHTRASQDTLQEMEWTLEREQEERAELVRRMELKQTALAKLTKEERELLNLV